MSENNKIYYCFTLRKEREQGLKKARVNFKWLVLFYYYFKMVNFNLVHGIEFLTI